MQRIERWSGTAEGRSRTVARGETVWCVANASDATAGFEGQARESLARLDAQLREAGSARIHLLSLQLILVDIADRPAFDRLWLDWIGPCREHWPQRACFQAELAPGLRLELVAVAAR